jgi:hypothetical protein
VGLRLVEGHAGLSLVVVGLDLVTRLADAAEQMVQRVNCSNATTSCLVAAGIGERKRAFQPLAGFRSNDRTTLLPSVP